MTKNFLWNAIGTTLNSFLSLFLLIIVTRCNGIESSGTFSLLFSISIILQVISNYGGRIYQVTDIVDEFKFDEYMTSRIYSSVVIIIVYLLISVVRSFNYSTMLIGLMLILLRIVETISDVIYGKLQKDNRLDIIGKSLTLKSVLILIIFAITNFLTKNLLYASFGLLIASLFIFIFYDLKQIPKMKYDFNFDIFKKSFFIFLFGFITLLTLNVPRFTAQYTLNKEELGYLGILLMIPTVMGLVCQFLLQPQLIVLINNFKLLELDKLKKNYYKINLMILGFSIFCIICAIFLGDPVLSILYGIPFTEYKLGFCLLIISGTFNGISAVYSNILTIIRKTKVQLIPYLISLTISPFIVFCLSKYYGIYGVFYSVVIIMFIQNIIFIIITNTHMKKLKEN